MRKIITLFVLAFIVINLNAQENIKLYGARAYDSSKGNMFDIVTFDSENTETVLTLKDQPVEKAIAPVAAEYFEGYFYMFTRSSTSSIDKFVKLSVKDWSETSIKTIADPLFYPFDMVYDYSRNQMYVIILNFTTGKPEVNTLDLSTGDYTSYIGLDDASLLTFACDSNGKMYGMTNKGAFKSINLEDGTSTLIASMGINLNFNQSMAFDKASGRLFWACHSGSSHSRGELIEINPSTGEKTELGTIGGKAQIVGLFSTLLNTELSPADGSEEIDIFATIKATFNKNITADNLSAITFSPTVSNISANITDNVLTISHDNFVYSQEYEVTIPKEALQGLGYDINWKFTTLPNPGNCNPPSQLNAENIQTEQALLSWKENGVSTSWNIKYGIKGFDVETEGTLISDINEKTYLLTGINHNTDYDFYVQAICYAGELSNWSNVYSFRTPMDCNKAHNTYPWFEGFEGEIFPPECWTNYDIDGTEEGYKWQKTTSETQAHTGEGAITHLFDLNKPQEGWLVTNKFAIPEGNESYILRFWNKNEYPEYYVYNGVWISEGSPNPADGDFVEVWSPKVIAEDWQEEKVALSDLYAGKDIYIAFVYKGDGIPNGIISHRWQIDDISIDTYDNIDIQLFSIDEPTGGGPDLPENAEVKVTLYNYGSKSIDNLPITLTINGDKVAEETISETVHSLAYHQYTFSSKVDFSKPGTYKIEIEAKLDGDTEPENNVIGKNIVGVPSEDITFYGYSLFRYPNNDSTFISFSTKDLFELTDLVVYDDGDHVAMAGEYLHGYFYLYTQTPNYQSKHFIKIDTKTWREIENKEVSICPSEMAYDYSTNTMYAVAPANTERTRSNLYTVNMSTGELTLVAEMDLYFFGLACDLEGQLYGAATRGDFCSINKQNGDVTIINNTGYNHVKYAQSMAFDHNTGRLFWALVGDGPNSGSQYGGLAEIDKTTGFPYYHGKIHINTQIIGLHTPYTPVGINEYTRNKEGLNFYPNPSNGTIHLSASENSVIKIMDMSGRLIETYKVNGNTVLNLNIPKGIYFIQLENNEKVYTDKLIIK